MTASVIPFPSRKPVIFIDPCELEGGCWGIYQQSPGHAARLVATRFAYDSAETVARNLAAQTGADFLNDMAPEPKGAA